MRKRLAYLIIFALLICCFFESHYAYAATTTPAVRHIRINGQDVDYEGTNGLVYYNGSKVNNKSCRSVIFKNACFVWAKRVFEKTLGCDYLYDESTGYISITKNDITVELYIDSHESYINGKFVYCEDMPKLLYSYDTGYEYVMVPGRFVCENLGYYYEWDSKAGASLISDTGKTGIAPDLPKNLISIIQPETDCGNGLSDPSDYEYTKSKYFTWEGVPESSVKASKVLVGVKAYSDTDGEYIHFSGTGELQPSISKKNNSFIISFPNTASSISSNYAESPVWNLLSDFNLYDDESSVTLCVGVDEFADLGYKLIYDNDAHTELTIKFIQRESSFYRQQIEVPIPKQVNFKDVEILDNYADRIITLRFNGDYRAFYENLYIPYEKRSICQIRTYYNPDYDRTTVNLYSDKVCAFKTFSKSNGHKLCVLIDRPENMYDQVIILDAGHGGEDPGTVHEGYQEKDINFNIIYKYAKKLFDASGIKVYYSRFDDTKPDLYDRAAYARDIGSDMFISVHQNSLNSKAAHGTEVYYSKLNTSVGPDGLRSSDMAYRFLSNMLEDLNTLNRDVRTQNFVVIRDSECPAVLLECGYMSNHDELMRIKTATFQKKVAKCIFRTVKEIYESYPTNRFLIPD